MSDQPNISDCVDSKYSVEMYRNNTGQQDLYMIELKKAYEKGYLKWSHEND